MPITKDLPVDFRAVAVRIPRGVVCKAFPAETVVLNLNTGHYHGLNPTAGRIVELLTRTGDVRATAARIAEETGQPARTVERDVCDLCAALMARGLLEVGDGPAR